MAAWKRSCSQLLSYRILGICLNFLSAIAFYFATYFLKLGTQIDDAPSNVYAYARYLLGTIFILMWLIPRGRFKVPKGARRFVFFRAIGNLVAVIAFYKSVQLGSVGVANVLNMTYPVFVVLFAGPLLKEWPTTRTLLLVAVALVGILMNFPWFENQSSLGYASIWYGILSAVVAGIAVVSLRGAVQAAPVETIMFWMFLTGSIAMSPMYAMQLIELNGAVVPYLLASAMLGIGGQWLLAHSYKYLEAATGSMISSSRILIAIGFGTLLLAESYSSLALIGALLIGIVNVLLALNSRQKNSGTK